MAYLEETIKGRDGDEITLSEAAFTNGGIAELAVEELPLNDAKEFGNIGATVLTVDSAQQLRDALNDLLQRYVVGFQPCNETERMDRFHHSEV